MMVMVERGATFAHLIRVTRVSYLATLACSHRCTIFQSFPFGDLMLGFIAVVDPDDQVGVFLSRLGRLIHLLLLQLRLLHGVLISNVACYPRVTCSILDLSLVQNERLVMQATLLG